MLEEDRLDGLQVILCREVHDGKKFIVELAMLVGGIAVPLDQIMEKVAMRRDMAVEIHAHEAAELKNPG